jgi:hypothetical protein
MSLDPRTFPTPVEPEWKADHISALFLDEVGEEDEFFTVEFEYSRNTEGYQIYMIDGYQYDQDQAEEIVLNHLKINRAEFIY